MTSIHRYKICLDSCNLTSVSHSGLIQSLALVTNHDLSSLSTSHWLVATGNLFQRYDGLLRTPHLTRQQPFQVLCVYGTHTIIHLHTRHTRARTCVGTSARMHIRTHAHMHASMHDACIHVRTYIAYTHAHIDTYHTYTHTHSLTHSLTSDESWRGQEETALPLSENVRNKRHPPT